MRGKTKMGRQGTSLSHKQIERTVALLATTDMTFGEIAQRMSCSKTAVASINRRRRVRDYRGLRHFSPQERIHS